MNMIDMHTHFLPKVDDGAKDLEMGIEMLKESASQGVKLCVSTSHCRLHRHESLENFLKRRSLAYEDIKKNLTSELPKIILGAEVLLDHDITEHKEIDKLCIGGSGYMLLEFPHMSQDVRTPEWIYALTLAGIKPIIAHIDRYPRRDSLMTELDGMDIVYQINAEVFFTMKGRSFVKKMLKKDDGFIISSDMHNLESRPCNMALAYEKAKKKYGNTADKLFYENAKKILKSEELNLVYR